MLCVDDDYARQQGLRSGAPPFTLAAVSYRMLGRPIYCGLYRCFDGWAGSAHYAHVQL